MIVSNHNNMLALDMNISGREFAKTKLMQYLNNPGILVRYNADGSCTFEQWFFTGTQEGKKTISMTGPLYEGKTFFSILCDKEQKEARLKSFELVRKAIEQSLEKGIVLPICGPECTLIGVDGSILFLPQEFVQRSVSFLSETDASTIYGCYIFPGLQHADSLRFTESVYGYYILSDRLPFSKKDSEQRREDYIDHNFIPLNYWISHSNELCNIITTNLSINPILKRSNKNKKISKKKEVENTITSLPLPPILDTIITKNTEERNVIEQKLSEMRINYVTRLNRKVKTKRFFRKKGTLIKIGISIFALILIFTISTIKTNSEKPTTVGLTPYEVTESFYTSINKLDLTLASSTTSKSLNNSYENMISSFYVTIKMREAYEKNSKTLYPGQWLNSNRNFSDIMFGITKFTINGNQANPFSKHHVTSEKKIPLEETNGAIVNYVVTYFLLRHQGNEQIISTKCNDIIELHFIKDRWLITDIESSNTERTYPVENFYKDYSALSGLDVYQKAEELSKNYDFIPSADEITISIEELTTQYEQFAF